MFVTVHAAVATIIGRSIISAPLAFLIGLVSHLILDIIPHGDHDLGKKFFGVRFKHLKKQSHFKFMAIYGTMDSFILTVFLIFIFKSFDYAGSDSVIWCIIGGILPDFLAIIYKITEIKSLKWLNDLHNSAHMLLLKKTNKDLPLKVGVLMQISIMIILTWVIFFWS
jgi:hypothetical protein